MESHLYLIRGKKRMLLVRYFGKLHFVNLDHRLSYKVRAWFLERPRTEMEMDEKGLVRESVDLKDIRGVAAGGTGRGMVVQFYQKEGKKRYELDKDCDLADMSALFEGLESFDPPKKDSNWSDPRLSRQNPEKRKILWPIGWAINIVSAVSSFYILVEGLEKSWVCWISLLCIPASITLFCLYPEYFIIFSEKRKHGQKKGGVELVGHAVGPACMFVAALRHYHLFAWWKAWIIGGIAVVILAVLFYKVTQAFRDENTIATFLVLGLLICGGPVLALNCILDPIPAREVRVEVGDKDSNRTRKGGRTYEVTVILDGEAIDIPVDGDIYRETEIGEWVIVELYDGAFGICFAKIQ